MSVSQLLTEVGPILGDVAINEFDQETGAVWVVRYSSVEASPKRAARSALRLNNGMRQMDPSRDGLEIDFSLIS